MSHLGIWLACEHFPGVSADPRKLGALLRIRLADIGHDITEVSLFDCYLGHRPRSVGDCDLWIVSGSPLGCDPTGLDLRGLTQTRFLKSRYIPVDLLWIAKVKQTVPHKVARNPGPLTF